MLTSSAVKSSWSWLLPVALGVLLFVPTLRYDFVYDDHGQIGDNPHLRIWPGWSRVLLSDIWSLTGASAASNYYRPLFFTAYWLTGNLISFEPWAFHMINIALYALTVFAMWKLAQITFGNSQDAVMAAALFAVHPVHVEAVAWVAALSDIACTLFMVLAFLRFAETERYPARSWGAATLMAVALLWKELAITLPILLLAYEYSRGTWTRRPSRWAPLAIVAMGYLALRFFALGGLAPATHIENAPVHPAWIALSNLGRYLVKLVFPHPLTVFHPPTDDSLVFLGVTAAFGVALAAMLWWRRQDAWMLLWLPISLAPMMAVTRIKIPVSERNLFLASVGFCLCVVWLIRVLKLQTRTRDFVVGLMVLGLGVTAALRVPVWANDTTLFLDAKNRHPESALVRQNLATEYVRQNRLGDARRELLEGLQRNPGNVSLLENLAYVYTREQDWAKVRASCSEALSRDPGSAVCHFHLALADEQAGDLASTMRRLRDATSSNPRLWQPYFYRGNLHAQARRYAEAIAEYEAANAVRPNALTYTNLGNAYSRLGRQVDARRAYETALRLTPSFAPARENLRNLR